jgi:DNA-binding NarL/FixJ family response regulator
MIRIVLADDHPLIRGAVKLKLEADGIEVTGEAADGARAMELVESLEPDVVILDREMPGLGGIEATRRILDAHPDQKVILLTSDDDPSAIIEAGRAGVRAYLLKDEPTELLLRVVRLVADGGIGPRLTTVLEEQAATGER